MKNIASHKNELTIGRLAKEAGVNVETIRYYERIGLIEQPQKPIQGFRKYPSQALQNVQFIKRAQVLGFNLQEITELMQLGDGNCEDIRQRAEIKRMKVESQIQDLIKLRDGLDEMINACHHEKSESNCPIVQTLLGNDTGISAKTDHLS